VHIIVLGRYLGSGSCGGFAERGGKTGKVERGGERKIPDCLPPPSHALYPKPLPIKHPIPIQ